MPTGVIFLVYIPSSHYEHYLTYGKPKDLIAIDPEIDRMTQAIDPEMHLEVKLRNKKNIPIYLTQSHYQYNTTLDNIRESDDFFTMESELLKKLDVEHAVWTNDKLGNYYEVMFPLPTGDQCETMLHCLTELGIGVRNKSIVNVLPCNVVHTAIDYDIEDEESILHPASKSDEIKMPTGVIFLVYIPSSHYEHYLTYGKPKDLIAIDPEIDRMTQAIDPEMHLEVKLRNKKNIPIYLTQSHYQYNTTLDNIRESDDFFTMESELLKKLDVEHAVWTNDKLGNYYEVMFPLPTGDQCETMLHCLTELGIGVRNKSIVNVLPCNVVHTAIDYDIEDEESILKKNEDAKRWRSFVESIRSKLTVKQVVDGVRGGGELSFDYLTLIITADSLAALGLVENNASNIVAAMLVSPLMGPVMSITFGTIIADRSLVRSGFESLILGMFLSLLFGFIFGLILGTTAMPWGFGDWPTEEMKSRGNVRSLWMGVLWALTSGTGVALALLQGSAGPLIGIAISASLLPPVVNCGLYWALACIWLLYPGVKIPHIKGESYSGNTSYVPLYHTYLPIEFAVNGIVSCCLTIVNVICIFITAIIFLKIKEVAAPYTSTPDLRRFWEQDIKVAREANRANLQRAEDDERAELVLEDLNNTNDEDVRDKLEAAVQEALDDETYRKVKRMSYQSHNADEVIRTIGLHPRSSASIRSSIITSGATTPRNKGSNVNDIATLDKLLTSLLGLQNRRTRSFRSHFGTPRASRLATLEEFGRDRLTGSWPEKIFEDSVVRNVISNLRTSKRNSKTSTTDELFLTPK